MAAHLQVGAKVQKCEGKRKIRLLRAFKSQIKAKIWHDGGCKETMADKGKPKINVINRNTTEN